MNENIVDVSVIICAYTEERWQDLLLAIESVQKQNRPPREIIVVVDHNTQLLARLQKLDLAIILLENTDQRGLSGARNSGLVVSQGSLIAFLDDDAIAEPEWLELLYNGCADPDVLGVGGMVEPWWLCPQPAWFPQEFYWVVGCSYQNLTEQIVKVRNSYGGSTCIRREVFETVGGFRNGIGRVGTRPVGGEETELSIRARQHWPEKFFLNDSRARTRHRITQVRAGWGYFRARCYAEGLSKALIARLVGSQDSLASERNYTFRLLPLGVLRGLRDGFLRRDPTGFLRAGAIVSGLIITTSGYLMGRLSPQLIDAALAELGDPPLIRASATPKYQLAEY